MGTFELRSDRSLNCTRTVQTTPPEGNNAAYTYDAVTNPGANNIASITANPKPGSPLTPTVQSFTYDPAWNAVASATDPRGIVTRLVYDASNGTLVRQVADAGAGHFNATGSFTYDTFGRPLTATDPIGTVTAFRYDAGENLISTVRDSGAGHLNLTTTYGYDGDGNVVMVTDPNGNTATTTFDADRRPVTISLPAAPNVLVTSITYNPDGLVVRTQQSSGGQVLRATSTSYTPTNKPATTTDANGNIIRYVYDLDDRLIQVSDPVGRMTSLTYDALSRPYQTFNLAIQTQPLVQNNYTPNGKLASLTDRHVPTGNTTSLAYDGLDRLSTTTWPLGSTEVLSYDADGNVLTRETRKGDTITFAYDTLNRLSTKAAPGEATVTYGYDLTGRLTGVSDTSPAMTVPSGTATSYGVSHGYDALNRPTGATWPNVPAQTAPGAASVTLTHGYNMMNQRITQAATDNSWLLYPAATAGTVSYTANVLNQYSAVGAVTPTYDGNGSLTFDGTYTYCYDAESRLTGILSAGTCASPTTTVATYAYDAQGRRKSKTVGSTKTIYVTDADNREVLEYDGTSGQVSRWYA
jgi:YD repeat-containing protein